MSLITRKFQLKRAGKNHSCDSCLQVILKDSNYWKHQTNRFWIRLHTLCYAVQTVSSIETMIKRLKELLF